MTQTASLKLQKEFEKIYDQHIERIYRFVYLKVDSKETAEDLTADIFARCWQTYRNGEKIEHISGFLYRLARNAISEFYRNNANTQIISHENVTIIQDNVTFLEKINLDTEIKQVKKALSRLPDEYQDLIIWRYLEELEIPEIAKIMEKSEEAVRMQLSRAMTALKDQVQIYLRPPKWP